MWDSTSPGLGLRATPKGKPSFVFQGVYRGKDVRLTIGSPAAWSIPEAQAKARELQRLIDEGRDPRAQKREAFTAAEAKKAADAAEAEAEKANSVTVGVAWAEYLEDRRPTWGTRHYSDHVKMSNAGGEFAKRGVKRLPDGSTPKTAPGPVHRLLALELRALTAAVAVAWATEEAKSRPTWARLCWRCLKAFMNWCAEHPVYKSLVQAANPFGADKGRKALGKSSVKTDSLQREQLSAWFAAVLKIPNPVISAYLQTLLLTGARPGEVLTLKREDVDTKWKGLTIRDKVEGARVIPLTPYVADLLSRLPIRNEWVFSSTRTLALDEANTRRRARNHEAKGRPVPFAAVSQLSASGHLSDPSSAHRDACAAAGLEGLTLHGLRRSFASLTEWLEIPVGVVAQIQGHKPSATAEKHYKRRPLDLLRVHHERIEAWVLEQAGIQFSSNTPQGLHAVSAA